jgi:hypothetical protein
LFCHTQEEIAEREGVSVQPVKDVISDFLENLPKNLKLSADHLTDFEPHSGGDSGEGKDGSENGE